MGLAFARPRLVVVAPSAVELAKGGTTSGVRGTRRAGQGERRVVAAVAALAPEVVVLPLETTTDGTRRFPGPGP